MVCLVIQTCKKIDLYLVKFGSLHTENNHLMKLSKFCGQSHRKINALKLTSCIFAYKILIYGPICKNFSLTISKFYTKGH